MAEHQDPSSRCRAIAAYPDNQRSPWRRSGIERYAGSMGHEDVWAGCTSADLVQRALSERDEDTRWNLVVELHRRGSEAELELARTLMSGDEAAQVLACDVLGQLGHSRM